MNLKERIGAFQKESWQLEVFISGGLVYWLYSLTDSLRDFFFEFYPITYTTSNQIVFLFGLYTISRALLFGFAANLLFRAIWLAYLGINYWYPNDVNRDRIPKNLSESPRLRGQETARERLLNIERWCNLSFSFAVIFALFIISLLLVLSGIIWVILQFRGEEFFSSSWITYTMVVGLIFIQLGIFDSLIYAKGNSNSRWGRNRDRILQVLDILSLSFLFKREFLVLKTNTKPWFVYLITALYLGLALIISVNQIGAYYPSGTFNITFFDDRTQYDKGLAPTMNSSRYESGLNDEIPAFYGCIQDDIIEDDYLKLFVVYWVTFNFYLEDRFEYYGYLENYPKLTDTFTAAQFKKQNDSLYQRALNDLFTVSIDQERQDSLHWKNYVHPITAEEGYVTYIPINQISNKEHELKLEATFKSGDSTRTVMWMKIPFWKQD